MKAWTVSGRAAVPPTRKPSATTIASPIMAEVQQPALVAAFVQQHPDRPGNGHDQDQHALEDAHVAFGLAQYQGDEVGKVDQQHLVADMHEQGRDEDDQELLLRKVALRPSMARMGIDPSGRSVSRRPSRVM